MNLVEDLREQNQIGEFLIVTPAGGRSFYINSHDGRERYEDFFLQEFLPHIERRYRIRPDPHFPGSKEAPLAATVGSRWPFAVPILSGPSARPAPPCRE